MELSERNYRVMEIRQQLKRLTEDLIQSVAGENVPNLGTKKEEFIALHNELREIEGKAPREVKF